jgi:hypothetical protein
MAYLIGFVIIASKGGEANQQVASLYSPEPAPGLTVASAGQIDLSHL